VGGMAVDAWLGDLAVRLGGVNGVVGVTLGGSRARGEHSPGSDYDLGLYYLPPLDTGALLALARAVSGPAAEAQRRPSSRTRSKRPASSSRTPDRRAAPLRSERGQAAPARPSSAGAPGGLTMPAGWRASDARSAGFALVRRALAPRHLLQFEGVAVRIREVRSFDAAPEVMDVADLDTATEKLVARLGDVLHDQV
jgi:Nucleotidyltransferase domain